MWRTKDGGREAGKMVNVVVQARDGSGFNWHSLGGSGEKWTDLREQAGWN